MKRSLVSFIAILFAGVDGYASYMVSYCARMANCATGVCANIMNNVPTSSTSLLTASSLTDGGTFSPGATISLSVSGGGERVIYVTAGSLSDAGTTSCSGRSTTAASATLTAPSSGSLSIVAIQAARYTGTVLYQKLTVTAAGVPVTASPSPSPPPPSPPSLPPCPVYGDGWTAKTLDASIAFVAHTKVEGSTFHLRMEATNTGWLGFGFAELTSGHMKGADMVTAAIVDGAVRVEDRHATFVPTTYSSANNYVNGYTGLTATVDTHADWTVVAGGEADGRMFVWLTRPLVTGDQQDRDIVSGMNRIIWAWHPTDTVAGHTGGGARGSSTAIFFGTEPANSAFPAYDGKWTHRFSSYTIPTQVTTYACQSFEFPTDAERHIVAIRPVGVTKYNHHAILHVCTSNSYHTQHTSPQLCSATQANPNPTGGQGSSPLGSVTADCSGLIWSWAVGMGDFVIPPEAGLKTGTGHITHVILEIHYDNPTLDTGVVDTMGFEAFYVNTLRANDAAMMIIGDPLVRLGATSTAPYAVGNLPAGQTEVHRQVTCPGTCTKDFASTINVFAHFYHMHHYGHRMYTEKYAATAPPTAAGGTSLGVVGSRIDFWDNGYQQAITAPYTIAPGETLQTHCWFNTASQSAEITFGTPTSSEMCQDFIFYYPAQFRGQDSNGNNERFAMCGLTESGGVANTLCGSLAQANAGFFIAGDQVDKGDGAKADPTNFGTANLAAVPSNSSGVCAFVAGPMQPPAPASPPSPTPSPPPLPVSPPPPFPPGAEKKTVYRVKVELVASGTVSDITNEKKKAIQRAFATAAGVPKSQVVVSVTAASVLISVIITSATQASADTVKATLAPKLADSASATTFLAEAAITVTATPTLATYSEEVVISPQVATTEDKIMTMHVAHGILMVLAFGLLMPSGTAFPLFLREQLVGKRWLHWHNGFQTSALLLATAGFIVALVMSPLHFRSTHSILGLVVLILSYLQGVFAWFRPHAPKSTSTVDAEPKTGRRKVWELLHKRLLALVLLGLPVVQVFTGVHHPAANTTKLQPLFVGLYFGLLALALFFLTGAFVVKRRAEAKVAGKAEAKHYDAAGASFSAAVVTDGMQMSRAARVSAAQQANAGYGTTHIEAKDGDEEPEI